MTLITVPAQEKTSFTLTFDFFVEFHDVFSWRSDNNQEICYLPQIFVLKIC